jgi:iron complex outermembrane receptor protein
MIYKAALFCSALAAVGTAAGGAHADQATTQAEAQDAASRPASALGEVVVVARKRVENQQRIPVAITSATGQQLQEQGVRQPLDLARIVPSLTTKADTNTVSGVSYTLRGQSSSDVLLTFSQPVGVYEDSINIPHPAGSGTGFFDLSRIEVLNGPQGTLYGRNTTGGAINIITRGADYGGYHGFLYGEVGNYADWKASGAVNIPIVDNVLAARLAYEHWGREGYGQSLVTGERFGGEHDDHIFRASLRFDPNPRFSLSSKLEYVHRDLTDGMWQTRQLGGSATAEWMAEGSPPTPGDPAAVVANTHDLFANYTTVNTSERVSVWHAVVDAAWKVTDNVTLRSLTGVHQFTDFHSYDNNGLDVAFDFVGGGSGKGSLPAPAAAGGQDARPINPNEESLQWTQEFDLTGNAFDNHLNWLVGGFYSNDRGNSDERAIFLSGLTHLEFSYHSPLVTNKSYAVFTQDDIRFNRIFSITVGARYTQENDGLEKNIYSYVLNAAPAAPHFICNQGVNVGLSVQDEATCGVSQSVKSSGISYLASLNAQVTPDLLLYFKTARGFRGSVLQIRAEGPPASPEIATDYEIGLKSEWFGHRLRVNLDAYDTEYQNKQETQVVSIAGGSLATPVENAASARVQGVEGQLAASPFAGLTLSANFDYLKGVYLEFPNALPAGATGPSQEVDASGVRFGYAPWTFDIGGRYEHAAGPGVLAFQADYSWSAAIPQTILDVNLHNVAPFEAQALANEWMGPVGLVNARIDYTVRDLGLTFSLFATNLFDKHYQVYALTLTDLYIGATQEPRMVGFSVRKSFGGGE